MKKVILILLFAISGFFVSAQPKINIFDLSQFPDTSYEVGSYTFQVGLMNLDTSFTFNDSVDLMIQTGFNTDSISFDSTVQLSPQSSNYFFISNYLFQPNNYADGDNIIVVWPKARNTNITTDTVIQIVYFISQAAGIESTELNPLMIYPNPATKFLIFDQTTFDVDEIFIRDISGKTVWQQRNPGNRINIDRLSPGTYLIQVNFPDGLVKRIKMIKE